MTLLQQFCDWPTVRRMFCLGMANEIQDDE
jgi:hypothetical protein